MNKKSILITLVALVFLTLACSLGGVADACHR